MSESIAEKKKSTTLYNTTYYTHIVSSQQAFYCRPRTFFSIHCEGA